MLPVQSEGVEEDDGRVVGVDLPVGDGLELLDQLHHLVVVLNLSEVTIDLISFGNGNGNDNGNDNTATATHMG